MRIKEVQNKVLDILQNDEKARSDDLYLYYLVCCRYDPRCVIFSFEYMARRHNKLNLPSYESVSRARRKLQNKHPELRNSETARHRANKEAEYKEYAREE